MTCVWLCAWVRGVGVAAGTSCTAAAAAACLTPRLNLSGWVPMLSIIGPCRRSQAQTAFPELARAADAVRRTFAILDRTPGISPAGGAQMEMEGAVELRRVAFAYPSRPGRLILKEFSLSVAAGTSCALVGGSGAGRGRGESDEAAPRCGAPLAALPASCGFQAWPGDSGGMGPRRMLPLGAGGRERPRQVHHHLLAGALLRPRGGAGGWGLAGGGGPMLVGACGLRLLSSQGCRPSPAAAPPRCRCSSTASTSPA
jgi:hypothetical protein